MQSYQRRGHGESSSKGSLCYQEMIKELFLCFLLMGVALSSPVPEEENTEDRGLIEDLIINMIRDLVINTINDILGITTTTTLCGGLVGGGLLCPPELPIGK